MIYSCTHMATVGVKGLKVGLYGSIDSVLPITDSRDCPEGKMTLDSRIRISASAWLSITYLRAYHHGTDEDTSFSTC